MQPEERQVMTMNQQTPDQGRLELRAIIGGIFDHVLRKEKENALLSAGGMETKMNEDDAASRYDSFGPGPRMRDKLLPGL
jgi:hypothetical protein